MFTKGFNERFALVGLAGIVTLTLAAASAGAAGVRGRAGGAQRGNSTHHVEGQRTANGHTRHDERTNANGGTTTRDANATFDPATKAFTKDVSVEHGRATPPATP